MQFDDQRTKNINSTLLRRSHEHFAAIMLRQTSSPQASSSSSTSSGPFPEPVSSYRDAMRAHTLLQIHRSGLGVGGWRRQKYPRQQTHRNEDSNLRGQAEGEGQGQVQVQVQVQGQAAISTGRVAVEDVVRRMSAVELSGDRDDSDPPPSRVTKDVRCRGMSQSEASSPLPVTGMGTGRLPVTSRSRPWGRMDELVAGEVDDEGVKNPCNTPRTKIMARANTIAATRKGRALGREVNVPLSVGGIS